jgi:hypothetical protein
MAGLDPVIVSTWRGMPHSQPAAADAAQDNKPMGTMEAGQTQVYLDLAKDIYK